MSHGGANDWLSSWGTNATARSPAVLPAAISID
jgi:hypothetical protein